MKTRFDYSPTTRFEGALLLLHDIQPVIEKLLKSLPLTHVDSQQYAISLLVKMWWNAQAAEHTLKHLQPFNSAPLIRGAFEALIYMKAALHDADTFKSIICDDLARRTRLEESAVAAIDKIRKGERFRQKDMPRYKGPRVSLEQLCEKMGFELYWHYYPLLSAETHPSPYHIYKTCCISHKSGRVQINVNPIPSYNETLSLILVHTLINGTRTIAKMANLIGFGEDLDKILGAYEYVLLMEHDEYL